MVEEGLDSSKRRTLHIIFINICSLRKKLDEIKILCNTTKPDVIALNEVWITTSESSFYKIDGYTEFFNCRDEREGGGGCGTSNLAETD